MYSAYHQHMVHKNLIPSLVHNQIHQPVVPLQLVQNFLLQDVHIFIYSPLFGQYLHISWLCDSPSLIGWNQYSSNNIDFDILYFVAVPITPNLLSMILNCDCPNSKLFPLLAALDTLRKLCDQSGIYKTSDNLIFQIFPLSTFIFKITPSRPVA